MALVHMDKSPGAGFKKLNFLLSSGSFPRETFANLLLLYCAPQHGFLDLAADVMAENPEYCATLLTKVGWLGVPCGWTRQTASMYAMRNLYGALHQGCLCCQCKALQHMCCPLVTSCW